MTPNALVFATLALIWLPVIVLAVAMEARGGKS